jgi:rhodanese-related sulfurtransferase
VEAVETITREELKEKMDRGDEFVLVETMPEAAYRRQHLPGAVNLNDVGEIPSLLPDKEAEIITYCSNFN